MAFDWSISGYPPLFVRVFIWLLITHWELLISLHLMHAWVFVFIRDIDMLIMMIVYLSWAFRLLRFFPCFIAIFVWDVGMLIMLIDHLTLLSIVTLILPCLFWLPHMYRLTIVYHLIWHDWFSWLYIILFIIEHAIICQIFFLINLCVDLDDIYLFCMTVCCMTFLVPCDCMSCLSMWDTHLSPYFQVPSLGSTWFSLISYLIWDLFALFALRPS